MPTVMDQGSMQFGKHMALYGCPDQQPEMIFMQSTQHREDTHAQEEFEK